MRWTSWEACLKHQRRSGRARSPAPIPPAWFWPRSAALGRRPADRTASPTWMRWLVPAPPLRTTMMSSRTGGETSGYIRLFVQPPQESKRPAPQKGGPDCPPLEFLFGGSAVARRFWSHPTLRPAGTCPVPPGYQPAIKVLRQNGGRGVGIQAAFKLGSAAASRLVRT